MTILREQKMTFRQNSTVRRLASVAVFLTLPACGAPDEGTEEQPLLTVSTRLASQTDHYEIERRYTGVLKARREAELGAEVDARIEAILVAEGETVIADQPLARLDTSRRLARKTELEATGAELQATLDEMLNGTRDEVLDAARARVTMLAAERDLAELQRDRRAELEASESGSQAELDEAETRLQTVTAQLAEARAQLLEFENGVRAEVIAAQRARVRANEAAVAAQQLEIDKSTLLAPFPGRVAARLMDEGRVVMAGTPILRLSESGCLEAWVGVPPDVAQAIESGTAPDFRVGEESLRTSSIRVLPELDADTRTVTVIAELEPEQSQTLRAGQIVRLAWTRRVESEGFWLPHTALTESARGLWSIRLCRPIESSAGRHGSVERGQVEVLYTEGDRAFVRGTLVDGDRVIDSGLHRIADDQTVQWIEQGEL
ncbi:MAG: efflux RND transporter periplasmic adaptor subunit [Planctomycetota bacterium]